MSKEKRTFWALERDGLLLPMYPMEDVPALFATKKRAMRFKVTGIYAYQIARPVRVTIEPAKKGNRA